MIRRRVVFAVLVPLLAAACTRVPPGPALPDLPRAAGWRPLPEEASVPDDVLPRAALVRSPRAAVDPLSTDPFAALARSAADRQRWAGEPRIDLATRVWEPIPLKTATMPGEAGAGVTPPMTQAGIQARLDRAVAEALRPICRGC